MVLCNVFNLLMLRLFLHEGSVDAPKVLNKSSMREQSALRLREIVGAHQFLLHGEMIVEVLDKRIKNLCVVWLFAKLLD